MALMPISILFILTLKGHRTLSFSNSETVIDVKYYFKLKLEVETVDAGILNKELENLAFKNQTKVYFNFPDRI